MSSGSPRGHRLTLKIVQASGSTIALYVTTLRDAGDQAADRVAFAQATYVDVNRGDFVVQNAANSGVGRWVIAFAKRRGLRTVNIVRRTELVTDLQAAGADASSSTAAREET